ncbi:hypothetical protein [Sphingomonas aracearum]|uniref:Uncharacterized protein n=1 Tax=Sphingomonas aracearum TaxID=2283317 RepID=A0A369VVI5_9SPHN|nr:hypothetical protein [Sphingomonas aracearum]RDE06358.1 hypothetical protein DVW87_01105 [Sphingomonas aracearum]
MSETPDQARTRRRWISLAEIATVAGLLIGAGGLYLNWQDRREDQAEKASATAKESRAKSIATLTGTVEKGDRIALNDAAHTLSTVTVRLPAALGGTTHDAMPGPQIDKDWFASALLKATDGGADERTGRLPVLVTATWWDGDREVRDTSLYDVLWRTEGQMLGGRKLALTGFTLRSRQGSTKALEAAWAKTKPTP